MPENTSIKSLLYNQCLHYIELRIQTSKAAMDAAQEAANSDTKSSAGDKYETTRAMMQIEKDLSARRLAEALQIKSELEKINIEITFHTINSGSLVYTNENNYFVSISAGKIIIDDNIYIAISPASPIGKSLIGLKANDELIFNNKKIIIKDFI